MGRPCCFTLHHSVAPSLRRCICVLLGMWRGSMKKKNCDSADVLEKYLRPGVWLRGRESAYHVQGPEFDAQHHRKGEKRTWVYTLTRGLSRHILRAFPFCLHLSLVLSCDGGIHYAGDRLYSIVGQLSQCPNYFLALCFHAILSLVY